MANGTADTMLNAMSTRGESTEGSVGGMCVVFTVRYQRHETLHTRAQLAGACSFFLYEAHMHAVADEIASRQARSLVPRGRDQSALALGPKTNDASLCASLHNPTRRPCLRLCLSQTRSVPETRSAIVSPPLSSTRRANANDNVQHHPFCTSITPPLQTPRRLDLTAPHCIIFASHPLSAISCPFSPHNPDPHDDMPSSVHRAIPPRTQLVAWSCIPTTRQDKFCMSLAMALKITLHN
ncbi:hypothetical protein P153DRAFT_386748 [Dothidotthia symphoricarpi CBS 119687]|uniref:Uncharacterized protein n=1 Tax=Dothidotthia symphoricarpi CBS 119687 TaxID=1392245 RepID=A0A6A6ABW5_9PLEO|nr:uncharacterized protein P153DRAFT_386748 [Dothidotthia symphoricarpi CBS 119687]KAF2128635.1 hypothetical protein P153DRAFT_386748 [Dothidotthia symphoricarpi CBS 119687]